MRFPRRAGDRAAIDPPEGSELAVDRYDGPERRGRPMSMGTRADLFFLSLLLVAAGIALFVILPFALVGLLGGLSGG